MKLRTMAPSGMGRVVRVLGILALIFTALVTQTTKTYAATDTVSVCDNSTSTGSLRDVLTTASSGDTITFSCSGTIAMGSSPGSFVVNKSLTIDGGNNVTIDGGVPGGGAQIFTVSGGVTVTLQNMVLQHAYSDIGSGGAVDVTDNSTLNVNHVSFLNNGVGGNGGAIETSGALKVTDSTFSGNTAGAHGGAIDANYGPSAPANPPATMLLRDTFALNTASSGGAVAFGTQNPAGITNSTFTGNSASSDGFAIYTYALVSLSYSTVANNTSSNPAATGSAIAFNLVGPAALTPTGSILDNGSNCQTGTTAAIADGGSNLTFQGGACGQTGTSDVQGKDPLLGSLANNGGLTQTMALPAGSPAVDAASCIVGSTQLGSDQRGVPRPQGPACDIGAYELSACGGLPAYGSGFTAGDPCLVPNGSAAVAPTGTNVLRLTDTGMDEAGSTYYKRPISLSNTFSTRFQFNISGNSDGIAFVIQNDTRGLTALACYGGDLGIGTSIAATGCSSAVSPSVAVEFDPWSNNLQSLGKDGADPYCDGRILDPNALGLTNQGTNTLGQHVGIDVNGDVTNYTYPVTCAMVNDTAKSAWIDYDGGSHTLNVFVATAGAAKPSTPILSYSVNLSTAVSNSGYIGFSAGTGTYTSVQDIRSWTMSVPPAPVFTSNQSGASTWGGTSKNPLAITGTATPNAAVNLYGNGSCSTSSIGSAVADASGKWSILVSNILSGGSYTYSATATDSASNVSSCSSSITVNVDQTAPTSAASSPALGSNAVYLNSSSWAAGCGAGNAYNICGTASDSGSGVAAVYVAIEGPGGGFWNGQTGTASAFNSGGTWVKANGTTSWGLAVPLPPEGVYTVASAAIDNAGNVQTVQPIFQQSIAGICDPSKTSGSLALNGGSLALNGGSLAINGGLCTVEGTVAGTPVSGSLALNGGSLALNGGSLPLNGGSLALNGGSLALNGGNCTLTDKSGNTSTYTFSTSTTLTSTGGSLALNGGSLALNGGSLALNGGSLALNGGSLALNGGSLPLNGGNCTVTTTTGSGSLSLNGGSLALNGGSLALNGGSLALNGGSLPLNGGSLSLNGGSLAINGGAGGNAGNVVVDTTAPVVSSFTVDGQNSDGAANINPSATFHIQFDESMLASTVNSNTVSVSPTPNNAPSCDVGDSTCQNASFSGFLPNTFYTVTVNPGATDLAGNGISNVLNTTSYPATFHFTTAAAVPFATASTSGNDDDGDGIPNGWDGTTTPTFTVGSQSTNTAAWGFSSQHKDLCLVESYMYGQAANGTTYDQHISQAANQAVVNAFANSPVTNPDGKTGVHLVIFEGPNYSAGLPAGYTGPYFGGQIGMTDPLGNTTNGAFNWAAKYSSTSPDSFDSIRRANFLHTGLSQFCHYAVIAHTLGGSGSSGASRGIGASDIVIALGGTVIGKGVGTQTEQQGTVMHELGHNLGLHHGGGSSISDGDVNYKPDYMSVMNYLYQFGGVPGGFTTNGLDYSHSTITNPLNETSLLDSMGLGSGASVSGGTAFGTRYFCPGGATQNFVLDATQPINWSCASSLPPSGTSVAADINGDGVPGEVLHDFNDWANLNFQKGDIGMGSVPPAPVTTTVDISTDPNTPYDGGVDSASTLAPVENQGNPNFGKFAWTGFFSPISSDATGTTVNAGKGGKTYPVKFQLKDATGNFISTLTAVRSITYSASAACSGGATDLIDFSTTSASGLHYDSTANQFVYNWATPGAGCYMLNVNLADGTTYLSLFSLS